MLTTQNTSSNSLIKAIDDVEGALTAIFNNNSSKWKSSKKLRKGDKMTKLRFIGDTFWNTVKDTKASVSDAVEKSIRRSAVPAMLLLKHVKTLRESGSTIAKIEAAAPIVSETTEDAKVCDNFYEALHLHCVEYKMAAPIIVYGRLYEEERFQYVSFIFGERVFIIELTTDISDIQQRASETMSTFIRTFGGIPKVSSFIKVLRNIAYVVAQIDLQKRTITPCELVPDDVVILNLNQITELMMASHYLMSQPRTRIAKSYTDTLVQVMTDQQPFLDGLYVNKDRVFGGVIPSVKDNCLPNAPIVLVFCDAFTQSNFLWNDKPLTVNVKQLREGNTGLVSSKMPYQQLQLLPMDVVSDVDESEGVRYGEKILYDGPLVITLD